MLSRIKAKGDRLIISGGLECLRIRIRIFPWSSGRSTNWVHSRLSLLTVGTVSHVRRCPRVRELPVPGGVQAEPGVVESADPHSIPKCTTPQLCAWGPELPCWEAELCYVYGAVILPRITVVGCGDGQPQNDCEAPCISSLFRRLFRPRAEMEPFWGGGEKPRGCPSGDSGGAGGRKEPPFPGHICEAEDSRGRKGFPARK